MFKEVFQKWWHARHERTPMPPKNAWWHAEFYRQTAQNSLLRRFSCHHATHATTFLNYFVNRGGDIQHVAGTLPGLVV